MADFSEFIWTRMRRAGRVPIVRSAYYKATQMLYRDGAIVTIRRGPAKGCRWRHFRDYQPWMAIGIYEPQVAQLISQSLRPGDVFYDIGSNAGYYTLIAARIVGASGRVVAFDPVPKNAVVTREQVALNHLQTLCTVEEMAVSDSTCQAEFLVTSRNANAHLADVDAPHVPEMKDDRITVHCTSLDDYVTQSAWPDLIKMDVEGAEVTVLAGASRLLSSPRPPAFLITAHSPLLEQQVRTILKGSGYEFTDFQYMLHAIPAQRRDSA